MQTIKQVTITDLKELSQISSSTFQDTFGSDNTEADMQQYLADHYNISQLQNELETKGSTFWFLFADDTLAGYLKLNTGDAQSEDVAVNALEVERIYILPEFKKRGFGTLLIEHAQAFAKESNKANIWLGVWEHNEGAKIFYAKRGFKQVSEHQFKLGNDIQRDLILVKSL